MTRARSWGLAELEISEVSRAYKAVDNGQDYAATNSITRRFRVVV